jgi:hypothetical protein
LTNFSAYFVKPLSKYKKILTYSLDAPATNKYNHIDIKLSISEGVGNDDSEKGFTSHFSANAPAAAGLSESFENARRRANQDHILPAIAKALNLNDVLVRKDLAAIKSGGRPRTGYLLDKLIADLETYLGYGNVDEAVLAGVGHLGRALLSYRGFETYGSISSLDSTRTTM